MVIKCNVTYKSYSPPIEKLSIASGFLYIKVWNEYSKVWNILLEWETRSFAVGVGKFLHGTNRFSGKRKEATALRFSSVASWNIVVGCGNDCL